MMPRVDVLPAEASTTKTSMRRNHAANPGDSVLVIGATGSVGREVVRTAGIHGLQVPALVRDLERGTAALPGVVLLRGDLEDRASLEDAVRGADAIVLVQGVSAGGTPERVDYGGVRHVLEAVGDTRPRLAVMTALYVTRREHFLKEQFDHVLDWRMRSDRD